jgi:hypothetical protein
MNSLPDATVAAIRAILDRFFVAQYPALRGASFDFTDTHSVDDFIIHEGSFSIPSKPGLGEAVAVDLAEGFRAVSARDLGLPDGAALDAGYDGFTPGQIQIYLRVPADK